LDSTDIKHKSEIAIQKNKLFTKSENNYFSTTLPNTDNCSVLTWVLLNSFGNDIANTGVSGTILLQQVLAERNVV